MPAVLVFQGHNQLRYLISLNGNEGAASLTIPNDAGASPDLQTDVIGGPLRSIARARIDGIGTIAAGTALTQGQARAILLGDDSTDVGNEKVPRAVCEITPRESAGVWSVDANVDGDGDPVIVVTVVSAALRHAYLDVKFVGGIGTT